MLALTFAYRANAALPADAPADLRAFDAGARQSFTSLGKPAAQGLEMSFAYPSAWGVAINARPNTVAHVASEDGEGSESCVLLVKYFPADQRPSEREVRESFGPQALAAALPDGVHVIGAGRTTLDAQPGGWLEYVAEQTNAGIEQRMFSAAYAAVVDRTHFVFLVCAVGTPTDAPVAAGQAQFERFLPLFQQIASTVIFQSAWK